MIWLNKSISIHCLRGTNVSSTYGCYSIEADIKVFTARVSPSSITMFAITADTGELISVQKIC